jgi:chemotaxis protein CheZ
MPAKKPVRRARRKSPVAKPKRSRAVVRRSKPSKKHTARPAKRARKASKPVRRSAVAKPPAKADGIADGVEHLARIIADAKRDLAALSARDIRAKHLPTAGDELTAIVGATEAATHAILDAVERIEKTANATGGEAAGAILNDITSIYEACNFQDITGQRISKIVAVLQEVDKTVAGLLETMDLPAAGAVGAPSADKSRTGEAALLNGPQMPDAAPNQADIDALFDKA